VRNVIGQTPGQLCIDFATREVLQAAEAGEDVVPRPAGPRHGGLDQNGMPIECEPELFFVTPEPVLRDTGRQRALVMEIGVQIFNLQPCHGMAFLVAAGLAESYSSAMRLLLHTDTVNRDRAGSFLGGALSLCCLVRFGVLDAMPFVHTGVVTALRLAFNSFNLPSDLQKLHRLVHGIAVVWWRKNRNRNPSQEEKEGDWTASGELAGQNLLQYLASADVLAQLMFSAVLLHWRLHTAKKELPCEVWLELNRGIEDGGADVPDFLQRQIYAEVSRSFIPELTIAAPDGNLSFRDGADGVDGEQCRKGATRMSDYATVEGWVQLLGGALPCPEQGRAPAGDLGEYTATPAMNFDAKNGYLDPACSFGTGFDCERGLVQEDENPPESRPGVQPPPGLPTDGFVWASLCCVFLFMALSPGSSSVGAPHALTDTRYLRVGNVDEESLVITLVGLPRGVGAKNKTLPVSVVLLLPDGRWRELHVEKLELKVATPEELQKWRGNLTQPL